MKKLILFGTAIICALSLFAKDIQELVVTTNPPMSCQNCENKIKKNIRWVKGVKEIETNIPDQRVTIEYDAEKTNPTEIENAFKKIGYNVEVLNQENPSSETVQTKVACPGSCCQAKSFQE